MSAEPTPVVSQDEKQPSSTRAIPHGGSSSEEPNQSSSPLSADGRRSLLQDNRQISGFRKLSDTPNEDIGGVRAQAVHVRNEDETKAMGSTARLIRKIKKLCRRICFCASKGKDSQQGKPSDLVGQGGDVEEGKKLQYRIEARKESSGNLFQRCWQFVCIGSGSFANTSGGGVANPNQLLAMYLHWMFRVNFFFLFALSCAFFFAFTMIFAGLITAAGKIDAECIQIAGEKFGSEGAPFADAFALSWTTFSTVGYGSTYPALGYQHDNPSNCAFITFICTLESFIGVLYAGFCGAILFGKVLRIQSHAQVVFSDPIVVRYGSGVETYDDDDGDDGIEEGEDDAADASEGGATAPKSLKKKKRKKIPCPVLEFRVVNRLFGEVGGEIMDATLNCVASVDADDVDPAILDALDPERKQFASTLASGYDGELSFTESETSYSESDKNEFASSERSVPGATTKKKGVMQYGKQGIGTLTKATIDGTLTLTRALDPFALMGGSRDHRAVDEDPTSKLVNKRIFSKLLIEASDHPFFKRVWLARHILDETSPVLTPKARKMIRRNGGYWPESLNNHQGVRKSLQFNQILVSLNGVSNVSASDVYAQKIYDFVDINIGYQFVNILYRDENAGDALKVDIDLINDVREQIGGGGEPLV